MCCRWLRNLCGLLLFVCSLLGIMSAAHSQIIYGVGSVTGVNGQNNNIFIVDPTTGLATTPTVANVIPSFAAGGITQSAALAVSPLNGLVYLVERNVANPRIVTWNPATGAFANLGNAATPATEATFIRSTFCPNGKYYIAGNGANGGAGAEIYELNPTTLALVRTIVGSNLPTGGSGDIVCVSNGDMFIATIGTTTPTVGPYQLFKLTAAQIAPTGDLTLNATLQGVSNVPGQAFNGLSETPSGALLASVAINQTAMYSVNPSNNVATTLTTTDFVNFVDLSRGFPLGLSVSKSITPTSLVQGTQTLTYSLLINNAGPAVVSNVNISDTLPSGLSAANWACAVTNAGVANTAVVTACQSATGTGNINQTATLSINGQIRYTITAVLSSSFNGTLTNTLQGAVNSLLTVVTPTALVSTATVNVQPAANLAVTKTNSTNTVAAGSTTTYTLTFSNFGPANAPGALAQDTPSSGLLCASATCSASAGAVCPAPYNPGPAPAAALLAGGLAIPTFNANSSLAFTLVCRVQATGLP